MVVNEGRKMKSRLQASDHCLAAIPDVCDDERANRWLRCRRRRR